jgi:hypothetical protein
VGDDFACPRVTFFGITRGFVFAFGFAFRSGCQIGPFGRLCGLDPGVFWTIVA